MIVLKFEMETQGKKNLLNVANLEYENDTVVVDIVTEDEGQKSVGLSSDISFRLTAAQFMHFCKEWGVIGHQYLVNRALYASNPRIGGKESERQFQGVEHLLPWHEDDRS